MLYVRLRKYKTVREGEDMVDHCVDVDDKGVVILDYNEDGEIVGVEVLGHVYEMRHEADYSEL